MDPAVAEAIMRRQGGESQQAPMMAGGQPPMPPTTPPMGGMPMAPKSDKFVPKDSHELLVSTLQESLKNEYDLKKEELKLGAPQQAPMMT